MKRSLAVLGLLCSLGCDAAKDAIEDVCGECPPSPKETYSLREAPRSTGFSRP